MKEMEMTEAAPAALAAIPSLHVRCDEPLAAHTRFGIGGPADVFAETTDPRAFVQSLETVRSRGWPYTIIGGGTNLIVSDDGFRGVVLRYSGARIEVEGTGIYVESGAVLQDLVDASVAHGLKGLETLAGIPGWVGAAIYGNAGAYGHSISERVEAVTFCDGAQLREFNREECRFRYRESIFKQNKEWIILSARLTLVTADAVELAKISGDIVAVRNEKFPPTMKCAGSIFKNHLLAELPPQVAAGVPERVIREGKVPAAYFLEQVGAKGMVEGGIKVADYHANLIFNQGGGTACDLVRLIAELKARVYRTFGLELEEEVQYVGFTSASR
jgi:UDP-N-acetylmuramate dehydrogenase